MIDGRIPPDSHLPRNPIYIFNSKQVQWKLIAPGYHTMLRDGAIQLLGSFSTPCALDGQDISGVVFDQENIYFPDYGEHYLHTNIGFIKLLLISPETIPDQTIVEIASFVSGNSVHSQADLRVINPIDKKQLNLYQNLLPILFTSDQPLKLHCGPISNFLAWLLNEQGYDTQIVQFLKEDGEGHIALQAYFPKLNKYVFIDPDFGVMILDKSENFLSINEIVSLLNSGHGEELKLMNIGRRVKLQAKFNTDLPNPQFAWSPDKCHKNIPRYTRDSYLKMLREYSFDFVVK